MLGVIEALKLAVDRAFDVLDCGEVVPIYIDVVYEGACKQSIKGFTWVFASLLIISVMSMIMIMFRSSYRNTVFEEPIDEIDESSKADQNKVSPSKTNLKDAKKPKKKKEEQGEEEEVWNDEDENAPLNK